MTSFALDAAELSEQQQRLIGELKKAVQKGNARERTAATMTLLKLCESGSNTNELQTRTHVLSATTIRTFLRQIDLPDVFVDQLRRKDSALLAAYALVTCLKHYSEYNHVWRDSRG